MIKTTHDLAGYCSQIIEAQETFIAIDTEFNRQNTYWPELCLIQIASAQGAVALDPLAQGISLEPLEQILDNPGITKVFHSARQDLEIFWKLFRKIPQPLFDTQLAALFMGLGDSISYDSMVEQILEIKLDKTLQFTDWAVRPLTPEQMDYALADVVYLRQLYPMMVAQLLDMGRITWVEEETQHLLQPEIYDLDPREVWRRIKTHHRLPKNLAMIQEIAAWREGWARDLDVNRGQLLRDENLLKIVEEPPKTLDDLKKAAGSRLIKGDLLDELADVIEQAAHRPEKTWPQPETHFRLTPEQRKKFESIRDYIQKKAEELNIPSRILAGRRDMESLARGEGASSRLFVGWRAAILLPIKKFL
jgi:ribonuclease D